MEISFVKGEIAFLLDVEKLIIFVGPPRFSAMFSSKLDYVAKISTDMIIAPVIDPILIVLFNGIFDTIIKKYYRNFVRTNFCVKAFKRTNNANSNEKILAHSSFNSIWDCICPGTISNGARSSCH